MSDSYYKEIEERARKQPYDDEKNKTCPSCGHPMKKDKEKSKDKDGNEMGGKSVVYVCENKKCGYESDKALVA